MTPSTEQAVAIDTYWLMIATFVLGFATVCLALFTAWLVKTGKDTAQRQLRADICDVSGEATLLEGPQKIIRISIEFKNSGQTPAYDVEIFCDQPVIAQHNQRPFIDKYKFAPAKTIIGAGSEFRITRNLTQVAKDDVDWVQQRVAAIFVWGRVNYTDTFKKRRHFVFRCLAMGPTSEGWKLHPHSEGYEAD